MRSKGKKQKRRPHPITRRKGQRLPSRCLFLDTETKTIDADGTQKMVLAYACYWRVDNRTRREKTEWFDTTEGSQLFDFIVSKCRRNITLRVLSANIWFDLRVSGVLKAMRLTQWRCSRFFSKGHTFVATFYLNNHRLEFVNIQNYFNKSVKTIGQSIGLPKFDCDVIGAPVRELRPYCKRDVEIIVEAYRQLHIFVRDNRLGSIAYTLPSVAFSIYTHSFIPCAIHVHSNTKVLALERRAYYGGRCECFFIGKLPVKKYYYVDVNSMYPHVMCKYRYPVQFHKAGTPKRVSDIVPLLDRLALIAEVTIETDAPAYPYRYNQRLVFPVGRFTTYLCTGMLKYAIEQGHCKKINFIAAYFKEAIFNEYVEYFYRQKVRYAKEGNQAFSYMSKILMNSLYGKFGQKQSVIIWEKENGGLKDIRELIWHVQRQQYFIHQCFFGLEQMLSMQEIEGLNSMPAIAAHVTDYARLELWRLMVQAGRENCFYCDTDSIIINSTGYRRLKPLLDSERIGYLKLEDTGKAVTIHGAKLYEFAGKRKMKGVPAAAKTKDGKTFAYQHFPTPLSELRQGLVDEYKIVTQEKSLSGKYEKGTVLANGSVQPYRIVE